MVQTTNSLLENETPANPSTANEDGGGSGVDKNQNLDSFNPLTFTLFSKRRTVTAVELQRAYDLAEAHARTITTSPHFLLVMTHAHVYQHFHLVRHLYHQPKLNSHRGSSKVVLVLIAQFEEVHKPVENMQICK